jgi:hypothetical protein
VQTITPAPVATAAAGGNITVSGNVTISGNVTLSGNATITAGNGTKSTTTTPSNLPTAPASVDGGGNGPNGAPVPGATGAGGIYGPPDGYISKATALRDVALVVSIVAVVLGASMVL